MKENVIDVLMYLRQNIPIEGETTQQDQESLKVFLMNAGLANGETHEAFLWLGGPGNPISRQITDRLPALGTNDINLSERKWIVLLILSSQPSQQEAFQQLGMMGFHQFTGLLN